MRLDQVSLNLVRLPLVRPFRTSSSARTISTTSWCESRPTVGRVGANARPSDPYYCPETTETCWHILKDFLAPAGPA